MTLYFENEGGASLPLPCRELAEQAIDAALSCLLCPYEAEVSLLLTTNQYIKEMNREFRGIDRETDVLSFPASDYEIPGVFDEEKLDFHPESGELMLGDIVISKERVLAQAEDYGHTIKREYTFLIVHSVLHLTGYDHMEEEERLRMEEKQNDIMNKLDILR